MISYEADAFITMKINRALSRRGFHVRTESPERMFEKLADKLEQRMFTCIALEVELPITWNSR